MPIADDVRLAAGVVIHHPELVNLYGCQIGADSTIGPFVEIQRDVRIGRRCKIRRCILDEDCVIPDGLSIGHDAAADQERFFVTRGGVVLVTQDMLRAMSPLSA